jgi:hypothetical protein
MLASVRGMRPRALIVAGLIALTSFSFSPAAKAQASAANQWTWMGGSDTVPWPARVEPAVYGTLGVPASGNIPGSQSEAATWTDSAGNFWLLGGPGNVLWKFNPSTSEWAWMGGSATGQFGVYGILGTPAPGNIPGSRNSAATWTDSKGHFWLYGGRGYSADNGPNLWLNDLWEFDPSTLEWTWMGGDSSLGSEDFLPAVYGTLGTPAAGNNPGTRESAVSWTDNKGNFWLFGGSNGGQSLNDLWEYSPSTNEWAWMSGSIPASVACTPADCWFSGVYGKQGTPATGNNPGARYWATGWTDSKGNLWLFGGFGYDGVGNLSELNDLWEYNPSTNEWAWMSGSSTVPVPCGTYDANYCGQSGVYGTLGTPAAGNVPGGRDSAVSWTDKSGNLWLFGGDGYDASGNDDPLNDLWEFIPSTSEWTWMAGSSIFNPNSQAQYGVFGMLGTPAQENIPGSRGSVLTWTDNSGNFWLYGGQGPLPVDGEWFSFALDDYWRYQPSVTPSFTAAPAPTFSVAAGTYTSIQTIAISDALPGATIYYTTDGSTPTLHSNTYTGPLTVSQYSTTETINAIAVASGYFNSEVASTTYVIDLPPSSGTLTTIASSLNPSNAGEYVTFTATVYAVSSTATPAGTVQFSAGNSLGYSPLGLPVALNSSGVATLTTAAIFGCGQSIMAAYIPASGSPLAPSTSSTLQQSVAGAPAGYSATTLASSQNPSNTGQSVTFTASVVAGPPMTNYLCGGGPPPSSGTYAPTGVYGTVQFYANGTAMGPQISVGGGGNSGVATYSTSALPAGTDSITAQYVEGNGYAPSSTSNTVSQMVNAGFTLTPSAPALTITQGGSGSDVITVTDSGGFSGSVGLSASGLPSGVTAAFSSGPSTGTSELALTAGSTAATGTFTITITGTSGALTASTTITLTVNVPASFTIAPSSAALSIAQGGSGNTTIAVNGAGGFSSSVTLAASGLPAGVTASFGTNPTTGSSTLTLAVGSTATPGIYSVTVTGTSTSTAESAATTVQIAVDSAGASAPPFGASAVTVAAGSTATYPVTLTSDVTAASVACMNLPAGATCSYSSTTNALTIATSSTTPAGTYQVTVVFTETVTAAAGVGILLPVGLLPLLFLRRKLAARGIWTAFCLGLILLAATVLSTGCSGAGSTPNSPPSTYQTTSSATVNLTVQ